jgi:hypothetical protein
MRSFTDERGMLTAVPRLGMAGPSEAYTASPENILVEKDFYAIRDEEGEKDQIVEKLLSKLEGVASDAMRRLLARGPALAEEQRAAWSEFMAVQVTRGRQFRETFSEFSSEVAKKTLAVTAANAPDEYFDRMNEERVARGEEPMPPITPKLRQTMIDGDAFDVVPSQEHLIEMSFAAVAEMTSIFFQMSWKLLRFEPDCLLTSDHPVLYWREPSEIDRFYGIGPITAREVRIALSPSAALLLVHPGEVEEVEDAEHEGDQVIARCFNRDTLRWPSSQQWLHRPGLAHPIPGAARRQWVVEWGRPWCRGGRYS